MDTRSFHITSMPFDMMGGTLDRSKAYDYARASIEKVAGKKIPYH